VTASLLDPISTPGRLVDLPPDGRRHIVLRLRCISILGMMILQHRNRFLTIGKSSLFFLAIWQCIAMAQKIIPPCPCYSIQVSPGEQTARIGDPVTINVLLANTVEHEIYVPQNSRHPGDLYFVDVRDAGGVRQTMTDRYSDITNLLHAQVSGESPRPTAYRDKNGTMHIETYSGSGEPVRVVQPRGKAEDAILLNDLYRLDKVGTYTVQIKQIVGKQEIDSNVVIVKIDMSSDTAAKQTKSANATSAQEAPNNDSLAVWVEMQKEQIPIGLEPLAVLTMKNMSDRAVSIHEYMYRAHVDGNDGEAPTTLVQRSITQRLRPGEAALRADEMSGPYTIWPDESLVRKFRLSYLYDLSVVGKYTVYCEVMDPLSHRWVRTKPATFEMTEKPRP